MTDRREPLDPDLLAAYAEGRLDDERRAALEERLADDDEARALVALLAQEGEGAAQSPRVPHRGVRAYAGAGAAGRRSLLAWAAAAVFLVGAGAAGVWLLTRTRETDSAAWLLATARTLAREAPGEFAGFVPLDANELAGGADAPLRGGLVVTRPRGILAEDRPEITWAPAAGVDAYDVTLTTDDGAVLWSRRGAATPCPYPADAAPLPRGREVVVEVAAQGPLGRVEGRVTARVATEREEEDYRRRVVRARGLPDDDREDLFLAHLALRTGRLLEAERAARAYLAKAPTDPLAAATLAHVERRLGLVR